ncbi:MAG: hypothetical protein HYT46_02075 [Candidatus Vogelbacteria bacterium]|nr:hypothetical protein [Candidatus Vogelbacteria bacterium]
MPYSQKSLIELIKSGGFPGETSIPKHIETVISNVFLFDQKVYKLYKNDNEFFNKGFRDISGKAERFDFTHRDFIWNQTLSPSIYLRLYSVALEGGQVVTNVPNEQAEELIIEMNRINEEDVLFEKLVHGKVSEKDCFLLGEQLANNLQKVKERLTESHNYYEIFKTRVSDLRNFIKPVEEYVSNKEARTYCDFLDAFVEKNRNWFDGELSGQLVYGGDMHSHNAVFSNKQLYLMDTFPPKEIWRIEHRLVPLYRIGMDLWVLSDKQEMFENFVHGYERKSGIKVDRRLDNLYVIWASAIMVSYLYMLQRIDPSKKEAAKKFHKFIRDYFTKWKI